MPEFKPHLQTVWWVVERPEWEETIVAAFRDQVKQFGSLIEHKKLDFTHKYRTGGCFSKKTTTKKRIELKRGFYFCLRIFQSAAESVIFWTIIGIQCLNLFLAQEIESKSLNWSASSLITTSTPKHFKENINTMCHCHIVWLCCNVPAPLKQVKFCLRRVRGVCVSAVCGVLLEKCSLAGCSV